MNDAFTNLSLIISSICVVVIAITWLSTIKIMSSYRNKQAFIMLISGLSIAAIPQLLTALAAIKQQPLPSTLSIISTIAGVISFIIINFVLMKMYTLGIKLRFAPILLLGFGALAAIVASLLFTPYEVKHGLAYPILDFYMFILIITMLVVTRQIDMPSSYFISLLTLFSYQLGLMLHRYVFEQSQLWLHILVEILPFFYYILLFYILLEWIMDRLLSTYQSAILDGLTGLYIRRHFQKKMLQIMYKKPAAIIFCDIDNFKLLNDTKGHQVADMALQQVAAIIKEEVSPYGIAGRYGGEELLGGIAIDRIKPANIAERIRERVEQETIVTVSVGFSTTKEADELMLLVKQADEAMYYAKTTGKNKVSSYRSIPAALKQKT